MRKIIDFSDNRCMQDINSKVDSLLKESPVTPNGDAFYTTKDFQGRPAHIIYVDAHCSESAIRMYQAFMQKNVLADKARWLFLIEGGQDSLTPEVRYFREIAKQLGIPTVNPIINPYASETIEADGFDPIDAAIAIAFNEVQQYNEILSQPGTLDLLLKYTLDKPTLSDETLAATATIAKLKIAMYLENPTQFNRDLFNTELRPFYSELWWELVNASNARSYQRVCEALKNHPQKNLFIHIGNAHMPVFDEDEDHRLRVSPDLLKDSRRSLEAKFNYWVAVDAPKGPLNSVHYAEQLNDPAKIAQALKRGYDYWSASDDPKGPINSAYYAKELERQAQSRPGL